MLQELQLFPTFLYSVENFLNKKEMDQLLKYILKQNKPSNYTFRTEGLEQNKKQYKSLSNKIKLVSKDIFNRQKLVQEDFEITSMWSNIMNEKNFEPPHSHANSFLSGVYYLKIHDDSSNIIFLDPRSQSKVISPKVLEWTIHNSSIWWIKPKQNSIIFFPSWLQHHVEPNQSKEIRVSIAFNIMFKNLTSQEFLKNKTQGL